MSRRGVVARLMLGHLLLGCSSKSAPSGENGAPTDTTVPDASKGDSGPEAVRGPSFAPAMCTANLNCDDGFCLIPAGSFVMGSPPDEFGRGRNNEDQVKVTFTHSFLLQQTEVTQAQWTSMGFPNRAGTKPDDTAGSDCLDGDCPAAVLGWCEAVHFANQLSRLEGRQECVTLVEPRGTVGVDFVCDGAEPRGSSYYDCDGYRLPTSGEWEYATRAGTATAFFSGPWENPSSLCFDLPHLSRVAWYCANAGMTTHPVCTREANPWGLYDLLGNASEAVADQGASGYGPNDVTDPPPALERDPGMQAANPRLYRGANWYSFPDTLRSAAQFHQQRIADPRARGAGEGFRLARTVTNQQ
ncbi:MAG: formylglycine-generating enzyme family protein [Proteobacteria bacterium]|nr:MAG: formylglycine-generating enzyme family protein [Pseudomonadota bacterium]